MKRYASKYWAVLVLMLVLIFSAGVIEVSAYDGEWSGSGNISDYSDSLEWPITLDSAGRLTVDLKADMDVNYRLYREEGSESVVVDSKTIDRGTYSIQCDLEAGQYKLAFYYYRDMGSLSYKAYFDSANETYTGDNNTFNAVRSSDPVPFGTTVNGLIAINDDYDYYKIVLKSSGRLAIDVHNDIEELRLTLYDGDERYLLGDYMEKGDNSYVIDLAAGTYYFVAQQHWSDTGTYKFTAGFTPSGETYTAENNTVNAVRSSASIPLAKKITGQLAANDNSDYYKIVVPASARYAVKVNAGMEQTELRLLDSNENYVYDTANAGSHYHQKGSATYTYKLKAGTYYLHFERYNSELAYTGVYSFSVKVSVPKPAIKSLSKGRKSFTVKWGKKSGVSGYEIQYARSKKFSKAKKVTVKKASIKSRKIKKLKAGKKYYVRMRAYKTINGKKYYSAWSKTWSVKTR